MNGERPSSQTFGAKVAAFYGALFVIYGMHVPFMPVWLDWRGLSAGEISAVMAAPFFLRLFVTPLVALAADRRSAHREILILLAWLSVFLGLLLSQTASFWTIMALVVPLIIVMTTIMPLTETIAISGVREANLDYGRMRLWGSLTFVAASFTGGAIIDRYGGGAGIWLIVSGCVLTAFAAHWLPRWARRPAPDAMPASPIWHAAEPRRLLRSKVFFAFLLAAGLTQASHATLLTFGTLLWQQHGLSAGWAGLLWAIAVLAEVIFFAFSGTILRYAGVAELLMLGAAVGVLRWAVMALDPPLGILVPVQLLHAITYGGAHIGAIYFIRQAVPQNFAGSAQALYATVASGLAMGFATLIAGRLHPAHGPGSYWAMAAIAAVALAAAIALHRLWDRRELAALGGGSARDSAH